MLFQTLNQRLKSRSPPVESDRTLISLGFDSAEEWRKERASFTSLNRKQLCDPNNGVLEMNLLVPGPRLIDCKQDMVGVVTSHISGGSKITQYVTAETGNKQ